MRSRVRVPGEWRRDKEKRENSRKFSGKAVYRVPCPACPLVLSIPEEVAGREVPPHYTHRPIPGFFNKRSEEKALEAKEYLSSEEASRSPFARLGHTLKCELIENLYSPRLGRRIILSWIVKYTGRTGYLWGDTIAPPTSICVS